MARIILVDDDPQLRYVIADILIASGHSVMTAGNGREAIVLMETGPPDLVITDLMMPIMSGAELVRQMRNESATALVPVILVTAASRDSDAFPPDGLYSTVIWKPFDIGALLKAVTKALKGVA